MELNYPVLEKTITSLEASIEFKEMCRINGFMTLSDIVELPVYMLEKKPGMNNHLLIEFFQITKKYGLEGMVREE
ncbi:MAG TPA: hypothetical protein VIH57_14550 [Bacteroidales bacterium]